MRSALIVIGMINTYDHEDADARLPAARRIVPVVAGLLDTARAGGDLAPTGTWWSRSGRTATRCPS